MITKTFTIVGMHCASCVLRNERSLKKIKGVENASVNFATHSATVEFDESLASEKDLYSAVIKNGYKVISEESAQLRKKQVRKELVSSKRKTMTALVLSLPPMAIAMFSIQLGGSFLGYDSGVLVQALLSTFVVFVLGWEFHIGMIKQARVRSANMDTLISIGTLAAILYSVWAMTIGEKHLYFETGAVITALILLGRYFEAKSRGQASEAIEKLLQLGAKTARIIEDGHEREVAIEEVKVGNILLVKPGEKMPVDGKVIRGTSSVD